MLNFVYHRLKCHLARADVMDQVEAAVVVDSEEEETEGLETGVAVVVAAAEDSTETEVKDLRVRKTTEHPVCFLKIFHIRSDRQPLKIQLVSASSYQQSGIDRH